MNSTKAKKNKYRCHYLAMVFVCLFGTSLAQEQTRTITGFVSDDQGPLPGVNVIVKNTVIGITTDFDGNFTIKNVPDSGTLVFSYIGYKTKEVAIPNSDNINVLMEPDTEALDEVVVIGYGTQKKSDLTGAVGLVDGDEIGKYTYSDPAQAIQGRTAGVNVTANGGAPGSSSIVTIRGASTLSDAGPLYVIDGMLTNSMDMINPSDIASISVLKDASASAIYGSRAANGVIIVTTKKGVSGVPRIDLDYNYGFQKATNTIDWANARQYADIVNRARDNDGAPRFPANDNEFNPNYNSDMQKESLRTAPVLNANLRFYGGSESLTYSLSLSHYDQDGIVKQSDYQRTTVRANATLTRGRFKLENTIGLTRTIDNPNPYFNRERDLLPTIRIYDDEGNFSGSDIPEGPGGPSFGAYYGVGTMTNSLGLATLEDRTVKRNTVLGNLAASFEFFNGLTYKLNLGVENYANNNFTFTPTYFFNPVSLGNQTYNELKETNTNYLSTLIEHTLNYSKTLGEKHNVDAIVGYTDQVANSRYLGVVARDFPSNDVRVASAAQDRAQMPSQDLTKGIRSVFGRLNYDFDSRYLFTATVRRDGSSLFKEDLRWGTFPSLALGWNLSNESFMESVNAITDIKFRASYGEVGSDNVQIYSIDPELNLNSEYPLGDDQHREPGYSITKGVNPNITWETSKTTDIGLEFRTLNQKLSVTADYFIKNSEDVLVSLRLPLYTGFGNPVPFNTADIENRGFEFLANYTDSVGDDLTFNVSGNYSILDNEVTALGDATPIIEGQFTSNGLKGTKTDVGQPVSSFFGYVTDGLYQTDEEATAANDANNPQAGDIRFKDLNGDGKIDSDDQTYLGNPAPDFTYGFNLSATYKGFDINLFFNGVSGNKILNANRYRGYFDTEGNYLADALNGWTPSNTNTIIPRNTLNDPGFNRRMSDFYLESGAYFRLKNMQVGYTLPKDILEQIKMTKLRLYLSASNVFTITDYTGYYPEVGRNTRSSGPKIFNSGVDEHAYPMSKSFQLGIQVSF